MQTKITSLIWILGICSGFVAAQPSQISITNSAAESVLKGNYNPVTYAAPKVIDAIAIIAPDLSSRISSDSLESYLTQLVSFHNRNSGSDTVSATRGIGAARRWVHSKFQQFSAQNNGRLLTSYLQFNQSPLVCNVSRHRNVFAVLPGRDTANHGVLIVEGHMDSRCESGCDINCKSHGADDDGSGTVLVIELARVLSKYTFNQTLVFLVNTGEEQGTYGANAFAQYCKANTIPVRAVQNNDVVGGIICGPSSSPPSCSPAGALDSTHIRFFSAAINFSMNKALGRFIKGQYDQWLKPTAKIPMTINIMDPVDRTGRGGDHQPFSDLGYPAIRFNEAFENGDGINGGRQHNVFDIIGDDTNSDGKLDKYYVNFGYLSRMTLVNAIGLVSGAQGLKPPTFTLTEPLPERFIHVNLTNSTSTSGIYKIAVRTSGNNDFALVYTLSSGSTFIIPNTRAGITYYVALAAADANGAQSLFSQEQSIKASVTGPVPVLPKDFVQKMKLGKHGTLETKVLDARGKTVRKNTLGFSNPK